MKVIDDVIFKNIAFDVFIPSIRNTNPVIMLVIDPYELQYFFQWITSNSWGNKSTYTKSALNTLNN
jgi:hypothetical protein